MIKRIVLCAFLPILACIVMLAAPRESFADDGKSETSKEYLLKSGFIYNFVKFTEWPDGYAISLHPAIDICVLGESPLLRTADIFKTASTDKLVLSLVPEKNPQNIGHCHIVFIARDQEARLDGILAQLRGHPVLTVSDMDNFAERGGMIGFVTDAKKIRLVVNKKAATESHLRIDAQLLEIALKVIQE